MLPYSDGLTLHTHYIVNDQLHNGKLQLDTKYQ